MPAWAESEPAVLARPDGVAGVRGAATGTGVEAPAACDFEPPVECDAPPVDCDAPPEFAAPFAFDDTVPGSTAGAVAWPCPCECWIW